MKEDLVGKVLRRVEVGESDDLLADATFGEAAQGVDALGDDVCGYLINRTGSCGGRGGSLHSRCSGGRAMSCCSTFCVMVSRSDMSTAEKIMSLSDWLRVSSEKPSSSWLWPRTSCDMTGAGSGK